jgi:hypothetical protein
LRHTERNATLVLRWIIRITKEIAMSDNTKNNERFTIKSTPPNLRNAHRRSPGKMRVSGFLPGDRWETRWENDPADPDAEHFYIWLRFDGVPPANHRRVLEDTAW